jgi:hypothetical protein
MSWIIAFAMTTLFFSGCATEPSRVEMDYGTSFKLAKFNQTLNPEAEKNLEPVTGIDAQVGDKIMEKYQKSFERPLPPPTFAISVPGVTMK